MQIQAVTDLDKIHPIAKRYAAAILDGMPPKQAELQQIAVQKMCELLFIEAQQAAKAVVFGRLEKFLGSKLDEMELIYDVINQRFAGETPCIQPLEKFDARPEIMALGMSYQAQQVFEALYYFFENEQSAETAAEISADKKQ